MKRGVGFEPLTDKHLPYAWAAYKRGAFDDKELFPEGLNSAEFTDRVREYHALILAANSKLWAVVAHTPHGLIPVGMVGVHYDGNLAFPHVTWFPEASRRNKIEGGVAFIRDLKKTHMVIITGPEKWAPYWRHLAKYGLLRAVGKIRDYYAPGDHAMMFQSVGE